MSVFRICDLTEYSVCINSVLCLYGRGFVVEETENANATYLGCDCLFSQSLTVGKTVVRGLRGFGVFLLKC